MSIQVNGLQFTVGFNGVLGPSGVGKTRLLHEIAVQAGRSGNVAWVGQDLDAFYNFTVTEYLCYAAGVNGILPEQVSARIYDVLTRMHLMRHANHHILELPLRTKVQAVLAKALLSNPDTLLCDDLLRGLTEHECMHVGYLMSKIAQDRVVVLAGDVNETVEGLFDTVCLLHKTKGAVHVSTNTAYEWVEGKVWEYVAQECPQGRLVTGLRLGEDGVCVREVAQEEPCAEVSQVTPMLKDAYAWWGAR